MNSPLLSIVRHELRQRRMYLLWWSLGLLALIALTVLAYGSVRDQADQLNKAFGHLSSSIGSFVGTSNMFSPVGYLNSQLYFITLPILFIIMSITLAGSLISKDEKSGTLELLLARPVGRSQLILAKALAGALIVGILGVVTAVITLICCAAIHIGVPAWHIMVATLWMTLFAGAFGAVAFMLYAASSQTRRLAATVAILLSFGGYILTSLAGLVHSLAWVAKLFPYHYYDPGATLSGHLSSPLIIYIAGMYAVSLGLSLAGFGRRDIS